jgi:hypothetical protein
MHILAISAILSVPFPNPTILIAHVLGYGYSEIINLSLSDFSEFLEISVKILKTKSEL